MTSVTTPSSKKFSFGTCLLLTPVVLVVLGVGSLAIQTQTERHNARKALRSRLTTVEFYEKFGKPSKSFTTRETVSPSLRGTIPETVLTNAVFHKIPKEGLPYWSIFLAVDPSKSNVVWGVVTDP